MAIENPSRNPFLGIYQRPQSKQPSNVGMGQPEDFLSSEEVIGRPDAQNTAQRSKASAKGLKEAYEATVNGDISEHMKRFDEFSKGLNIGEKTHPFTGAKKAAFEAAVAGRQLSSAQQAIVNANFAEFQAAQSSMMGYQPRDLMKWGGGGVGSGQSSSTGNRAAYGEKERNYLRPDEIAQRQAQATIQPTYNGRPIAAPTPRFDAMKAMNPPAQKTAKRPLTQEEEARLGSIFVQS
jgi:hypothetical protein